MRKAALTSLLLLQLLPGLAASESKPLLEPAPDFKASPAYKALARAGVGAKETGKIEYLLERLERSSCFFIRNRKSHNGKTGAAHLRRKYQSVKNEIKTARDFARKVASRSRKSSLEYEVKMKDGRIYKAGEILINELELLEAELRKAKT